MKIKRIFEKPRARHIYQDSREAKENNLIVIVDQMRPPNKRITLLFEKERALSQFSGD